MSSGKAAKQHANKKQEKNEEIDAMVMKYYLTEGEMPSYVMNVGNSIQEKYKDQFGMMITQFGVIAANLRLIETEVKKSSLSKASKDKILNLINVSMGE